MMDVVVTCPFCGKMSVVSVAFDDYANYLDGGLAQDCFPNLTAQERELIISGMCLECQEEIFGNA